MVQILRIENPLFGPGLSIAQRLCYFNEALHFLFAVPRLIFLTVPLTYLLLGMVNIYGYSLAVLAYALPHIVLSKMANARIQGRYRFSFWSEVYETVLAPYILVPTLLALVNPRLGRFNVTSKGGVINHSYFDFRMALPLLILLALNIAGLFMAGRRWAVDPAHHDSLIMNIAWTIVQHRHPVGGGIDRPGEAAAAVGSPRRRACSRDAGHRGRATLCWRGFAAFARGRRGSFGVPRRNIRGRGGRRDSRPRGIAL